MSDQRSDRDERFDQDLRSVLLEDAPRDVPEDLRRRVAAVAATHPAATRPSGTAWRHSVPLWIGAVAAVVVALAVASWWFGAAPQPGVGGPPSSSPAVDPSTSPSSGAIASPPSTPATSASPSSRPGASPSPTPASSASGACGAVDLQGRILGWQGAAGSRIADVEITNIAARSCAVRGTPGLQLVDAGGRVLIDSATAGPSGEPHVAPTDPELELAPGGRLRTLVQTSNYCGDAPTLPIDIALTLPSGGGRFVATPGAGVSSADATPPCLGSTGGQITMNGWRR